MFFKTLRGRRWSKGSGSEKETEPSSIGTSILKIHPMSANPKSDKSDKKVEVEVSSAESKDYLEFLEKARSEEKKKQEAVVEAIRGADQRRRAMNMDPWAKKLGKF